VEKQFPTFVFVDLIASKKRGAKNTK